MSSDSNNVRNRLSDSRGVTSLEWALVAAAFMMLIVSIFDLVRYVVVLQSVTSVMTEAGRTCLVNPQNGICYANSASWPVLSTVAPSLDPSKFNVAVLMGGAVSGAPSGSIPAVNAIQVTVSYPYQSITPWLSSLDATISETATYFN
ncbi:MAG TPA: TadE/TadG family type IV pilus assembly protein [Rhodopila sp.]|jgi:hypothetical protein|nr:TadE/TadG family type IV pilus assembly protein [Rhodopila sp.]